MTDVIEQFREAIAATGLTPPRKVVADGRMHRFAPNGTAKDDAGWYVLYNEDIPAGAFGDWRSGVQGKWRSDRTKELSAAERRAYREKIAAAKKQAEQERLEREAEAARKAERIWSRSSVAASDHPYLVAKGITAPQTVRQYRNLLVVPVRDGKEIVSLQFVAGDGAKRFLKGSRTQGCYLGIGKPANVIVIVEGLATACSVRQATGHAVVCAFSAGNVPPVAKALRERFPDATLVYAPDNDPSRKNNHGHEIGRRGQKAAARAVKEIGGVACLPDQPGDDWNDVHQRDGIEVVQSAFTKALSVKAPATDRPSTESPATDAPPADSVPDPVPDDRGANDYDDGYDGGPGLDTAPFRPIGYNRGQFYFIDQRGKQVIEISARGMGNKQALFQLAPLQWWEREFPSEKGFSGGAVDRATNWLIDACYEAGVYTTEKVRGRGAWWDEGRVVLHCGDHVRIDGRPLEITDIRSAYVYEAGQPKRPPATDWLHDEEAHEIYDLARSFSWETPLSGILLAGFVALARLGGALNWRPHIWLTGPRGCGKSVVLRDFVQKLCGDWYLDIEGEVSSAFVRQKLVTDAFAVTYDEGEAKDQAARAKLQAILALVRSASREGGGAIGRGGQTGQPTEYRIRSCFAIASIYVNLQEAADFSRTSVLALRDTKSQSKEEWKAIEEGLDWVRRPEVADALLSRSLKLLPVIRENQRTFAEAIRQLKVGDQRFGDQIGTLLAGAYSLVSPNRVSTDAAERWIKDQDWSDHVAAMEEQDEVACLRHLMQSPLAVETDRAKYTRPIGELLAVAAGFQSDNCVTANDARDALRRNGMRVDMADCGWRLAVAHKHLGLSRIFRDTQYAVDYARLLKRLPFAWSDSTIKPRFLSPAGEGKGSGGKSSAVFLKLQEVLEVE